MKRFFSTPWIIPAGPLIGYGIWTEPYIRSKYYNYKVNDVKKIDSILKKHILNPNEWKVDNVLYNVNYVNTSPTRNILDKLFGYRDQVKIDIDNIANTYIEIANKNDKTQREHLLQMLIFISNRINLSDDNFTKMYNAISPTEDDDPLYFILNSRFISRRQKQERRHIPSYEGNFVPMD